MLAGLALVAHLLAAGGLLGQPCAVERSVDEFYGTESIRTTFPLHETAGPGYVAGMVSRFTDTDGAQEYSVSIMYGGPSWLFISPGPSLLFLVDGELRELSGGGSVEGIRRTVESGVTELASYAVAPDDVRWIAEGEVIRVRLIGREGHVDADLDPMARLCIRRFIRQVIDGETEGSPSRDL